MTSVNMINVIDTSAIMANMIMKSVLMTNVTDPLFTYKKKDIGYSIAISD